MKKKGRVFFHVNADEIMDKGGGPTSAINQCKTEFTKKYGKLPTHVWMSHELSAKLHEESIKLNIYNNSFPNIELRIEKVLGLILKTDEFLLGNNIFCERIDEETL